MSGPAARVADSVVDCELRVEGLSKAPNQPVTRTVLRPRRGRITPRLLFPREMRRGTLLRLERVAARRRASIVRSP